MTDENPKPSATPEWRDQDEGADAASDRTYNPSVQQVNRARIQGVGVGQKELNTQHDPTRYNSAEQYGAAEGTTRDPSSESGGGPARARSGSEGGTLDADPSETGDQ